MKDLLILTAQTAARDLESLGDRVVAAILRAGASWHYLAARILRYRTAGTRFPALRIRGAEPLSVLGYAAGCDSG